MAFWKRWRRRQDPEDWLPVNEVTSHDLSGINLESLPLSLNPRVDPKKTRIYDDEVEEDWRDPITEADDD